MSKQPVEKPRITLEELLVRAEEVKQYLAALESRINELATHMAELQLARTALTTIPSQGGDGYVVTDRLSTVYIPVNIPSDWRNRVLVSIGLSYYVKTSSDEALKIIDKRINDVRRTSDLLNRQYTALLNEYNALQQAISQIYAQALQARQQPKQ